MQRDQRGLPHGSRIQRHLKGAMTYLRSANKSRSAAAAPSSKRAGFLYIVVLLLGALISARWINNALVMRTATRTTTSISTSIITSGKEIVNPTFHSQKSPPPTTPAFTSGKEIINPSTHQNPTFHSQKSPSPTPASIPFTCPTINNKATDICRSRPLSLILDNSNHLRPDASPSCPDYFRWIHEDLRPWKSRGITKEMVEKAGKTANFRLVVLDGRVYVERYRRSFQTRDMFTIWGILQLLRRYPGRIPDLDLMFDCDDWPVVRASDYRGRNAAVPPLFRFCADDYTLDIVFPDWSFWGWPEINIKPWEALLRELKEGNERVRWMDREPYAYWKGNPAVAVARQDLLKCNVSQGHDWNARLYAQDWASETQKGFKESDLAGQCIHRYKIYIEGTAWSVSEKYILACDSLALLVRPRYYDFFTRDLMPVHHYWPVRFDHKCSSIKFAVDWGNSHKRKAQAIGKEASSFIQEKLKMDYVYDYMFHLLNEYAKLLRYKPTKPSRAIELCAESMACRAEGLTRKFMMESMVNSSVPGPCSLPPPYTPTELRVLQRRKANSIKQVEIWEQRA